MKLSTGSIAHLKRGAEHKSLDYNGVDEKGNLFDAGQIQSEGDEDIRYRLGLNELQPVLQVVSCEWHGTYDSKFVITVTDGNDEMYMMPCRRDISIRSRFMKQWGMGTQCKLSPGTRFKLLDYTTEKTSLPNTDNPLLEHPVIRVEKIRLEPKSRVNKSTK